MQRATGSRWADAALAVVVALLGMGSAVGASQFASTGRPTDLLGLSLAGLAGLSLAPRRVWPLGSLALTTAFTSGYLIIGYHYSLILLSFFIAVYTVARHLPPSRSLPAAGAALGVLLIHIFVNENALPGLLGLIPGTAWAVVPFAIGFTRRVGSESATRARAETLRQHVFEERLRVAQEVHDVVGHGLAAIKMQADIALHVLGKKPDQAEAALDAISRTSSDALEELRATLALVRQDSARAPAPGLDRLDELCERMTRAGMQVDVSVTGRRGDIPMAVDLAGYRVVQESLTNVLRHSDIKTAAVTVGYEDGAVSLSIANPVSARPTVRSGLGIPGMRHRVESLGGFFDAGPTDAGRFEVRAHLPIGASS